MPTPNPTTRREYRGAAAATTLQNSMTSTDTSFVLVAASNWPTGSVGKFVVTVNRGQADEEKILCDTQSSRSVACLLANRGFDGTTAQAHAAGATVECTISAFDADEWNQHTNATSAVHGVAGSVVGTTDTQTLTNKTLTAPAINGATVDAASTVGGVTGTAIAQQVNRLSSSANVNTNPTLTTSMSTVASVTVTTTGRPLVIASSVVYNNANSGANKTCDVKITVDGTTVGFQEQLYAPYVSGIGTPLNYSKTVITTPTAASHTIAVQMLASAGASVSVPFAAITVFEL